MTLLASKRKRIGWHPVKTKKDLKEGMSLRVPWPDEALMEESKVWHKVCKIKSINKKGLPIVELPSGGVIELMTIKGLSYYQSEEE